MAPIFSGNRVYIRASTWQILVRVGDNWACFYHWADVFKFLRPDDILRIHAVEVKQ